MWCRISWQSHSLITEQRDVSSNTYSTTKSIWYLQNMWRKALFRHNASTREITPTFLLWTLMLTLSWKWLGLPRNLLQLIQICSNRRWEVEMFPFSIAWNWFEDAALFYQAGPLRNIRTICKTSWALISACRGANSAVQFVEIMNFSRSGQSSSLLKR